MIKQQHAAGLVLALSLLWTTSVYSLDLPEPARPIDDFVFNDGLAGMTTLRENFRVQVANADSNIPFGRALFTLGALEFLGLNPNLNSFEVSTLEVPLGGEFPVFEERPWQPLPRVQRANRRLDSVRWLEPM